MESLRYHNPVLLQESINALGIKAGGVYVDITYGGGGHSREILDKLDSNGHLYAFDKDDDALKNIIDDSRLTLIKSDFRYTYNFLRLHKAIPVDGIIGDLGVSSHQIDDAGRGFSYRFNSDLDMRMDRNNAKTAYDIINGYNTEELKEIFAIYGELDNPGRLATQIMKHRLVAPVKNTEELLSILERTAPKGKENQFYSKVFQALRIEVNDELASLKYLLKIIPVILKPGGIAAIISYHSLEDRLVKNFFRAGNFTGETNKDFYGNILSPLQPVNKKAITASEEEISSNNRARSARLRIAIKSGNV